MILAIHILIATMSLLYTTYVLVSPSEMKLKACYGFVAATVISGTYLVLSMPAHMVSACITGLTYLGVMFLAIAGAHRRLASERVSKKTDTERQ